MLKVKDLWGFIDGKETKPKETVSNMPTRRRRGAHWMFKMLVVQSVSKNQLLIVQNESIAKGIWDVLQTQHVDKGLTNMLFMIQKFFSSQMALGDSMQEHLSKFGAIEEELDVIGATIREEVKVMVLLTSLLQSYEYLVHIFGVFRVFWS